MSVPQTIGFEMRVFFRQIERSADKPEYIDLVFHVFEKMMDRYRVERKRRKVADRATSAQYRLFLTDHGRRACEADADCKARHADVDGRWLNV